MKKSYLLLLLLSPSVTLAGVYKCVSNGEVSYSAEPCKTGAVPYDANRMVGGKPTTVTVRRGENGAYALAGTVNGMKLTFLVDTGASRTVISGRVASALGLSNCKVIGYASTANGIAAACGLNVSNLSVAGFQFSNVDIVISPAMVQDALLGNDLLTRFKIEQQDGIMVLSK